MGLGAFTLFPNQEHIERSGFDLFNALKDSPSDLHFPFITGCVTYRFDNTVHKTPFTVQVTRKPSEGIENNSPDLLAINTGLGPIPANLISLRSMNWPSGIQPD